MREKIDSGSPTSGVTIASTSEFDRSTHCSPHEHFEKD
jgi:hypothetical protein